jgi:cytochrome c
MRLARHLIVAAAAVVSCATWAQEKASEADARKLLASISDLAKSKGVDAAAEMLNKFDGVDCRVKDAGCLIATADAKVIANPRNPMMVGQQFPDLMDIDGKPITEQILGPLKAGKASWEASYRMNPPGQKVIVPRRSLCNKLDAAHAACVTISQ